MTISEISGVEREHRGNTLVPLGGKLPHYLALRTSLLLDCLQALVPKTAGKHNRLLASTTANAWVISLASRARLVVRSKGLSTPYNSAH